MRRDTSPFKGVKVVPPLCLGLECGLSGDASSADGNAAEDSVVNEAPRLPSITEGLFVQFAISISQLKPDPKLLLTRPIVNRVAMHVASIFESVHFDIC